MARKGNVAVRTVILWSIACVVLVVVAFAFFAPQQLWASVTKSAFSFGMGALPDQEAPQLEGEESIPPQLESEFDILVQNINNANDPAISSCLVDITELDGLEDNWRIELSDNKAILYRISGKGARLDKKTATINNFKPCTIKGTSALNFYSRYLTDAGKSNVDISPLIESVTLSRSSRYKYLYKNKDNEFCTFAFYGDSCKSPKNGGNDGIPDVCKSKIPLFETNLWMCKDKALATELPNKASANADAQKIADSIKKGLASPADKCLVKYDPLSLSSWRIGMVQDKDADKIKFVQVDNLNNIGKLDVPIIDGQMCIINSNNGINPGDPISPQRMGIKELDGKYHLTTGGKYDNDDNAYFNIKDAKYSALYKKDASHICFLALRQDSFGGCGKSTDEGIDDDCYKDWVDTGKIAECSFIEGLKGVLLCDDEHCLDSPPTKPWRKTTSNINSICDAKPSNEDSEPDGTKICGEIGSIRIIGNYDVFLYEDKNYKGKSICFSDEGGYNLDNYEIVSKNGWNKDTDSVKILPDGSCANPGITI